MSRITVDCHYCVKVEGIVLVGNQPICGVLIMCRERADAVIISSQSLRFGNYNVINEMSYSKQHVTSSLYMTLLQWQLLSPTTHMVLDKITCRIVTVRET